MNTILRIASSWERADPNEPNSYDQAKQRNKLRKGYIPTGVVLVDKLFTAWKPVVEYRPGQEAPEFDAEDDAIYLLGPECYTDPVQYARSAAHELGHWSGHKSRLARRSQRQGERVEEELTAELTSAILLDKAGALSDEELEHSASYVGNWLKFGLRMDPIAMLFGTYLDPKDPHDVFVLAADEAEKAARYLLTRVNYGAPK